MSKDNIRDIIVRMNGQLVYENYPAHDDGKEPEGWFEEYAEKTAWGHTESEVAAIWRIFITSLICHGQRQKEKGK